MLDDTDKQIRERMDALTAEVIRLWHALLAKSPPTTATGMLALRCSASWRSICLIVSGCRNAHELELCSNDAAALLRCMHDVCIQAEYIAAGDSSASMTADDLGRLFVEYEHVERHRLATAAVTFRSEVAELIRRSPLRSEGEARNQAEFDRVAPNYPDKRHWYRGHLPTWREGSARKRSTTGTRRNFMARFMADRWHAGGDRRFRVRATSSSLQSPSFVAYWRL